MELKNQPAGMEELWIESASNGDLDAFNQLVLKHQDAAYHHALAMLNDEWLAQEVTQDSFLKAFQNIRGFRGGSFRAWLMRIVTNTAYDWLRQSARRPTQPLFPKDEHGEEMETPFWIADPNALVEDAVEQNEDHEFLYRNLNELQDIYRDIITLIDIQGFDYLEAAQALNVPVGTVKSRLARARIQMRDKLRHVTSHLGELHPVTANYG
ncbi:sigma-70 family RNA polymerase sigma factor [Candidatus Villigracilis affinis]|uniref:RNA polymerase sigma factor n=1 Tax=Candidatus Villigracilis affinis TaxID=3140682 RepID=UPI002A2348C4|nr:sigma-70 family RNA polymerase sigma factor [Anaerolineales bacterium]